MSFRILIYTWDSCLFSYLLLDTTLPILCNVDESLPPPWLPSGLVLRMLTPPSPAGSRTKHSDVCGRATRLCLGSWIDALTPANFKIGRLFNSFAGALPPHHPIVTALHRHWPIFCRIRLNIFVTLLLLFRLNFVHRSSQQLQTALTLSISDRCASHALCTSRVKPPWLPILSLSPLDQQQQQLWGVLKTAWRSRLEQ